MFTSYMHLNLRTYGTKGLLPNIFQNIFKYANTVHNYNTRYAANQNLNKSKVRTNTYTVHNYNTRYAANQNLNKSKVRTNIANKESLL